MKKFINFRPTGRLGVFLKFLFVVFVICLVNNYWSAQNSLIISRLRDQNITVDGIMQLMQRGKSDDGKYFAADFFETPLDDGLTDQAKRIIKELNLKAPGENGTPVYIPDNASDEIKKLNQTLYDTYKYNALVSSLVSLNRNLPDKRSEYCRTKEYPKNLTKVTVLIPFHDDDWMLFMRTVHSVLLRTPDHLLEEVLIVQDYSPRDYYHAKLDEYLKKYPKIRHIKSARRQGIIPTRNLGIVNAKSEIIVSVDSHVEGEKFKTF